VQPFKELSSAAELCAGRSCELIRQLANVICAYVCIVTSLLLIYRPRKDERLSWPSWLTCSGRFTHCIPVLYCMYLSICLCVCVPVCVSVCLDCQSYALSIRVLDEQTNTYSIKHYRIRKFHNGQVGVSQKKQFSSVVQLVAYYRGR